MDVMVQESKVSKYTLKVSKRTLLFEAACVWFIAGGILSYKGFILLTNTGGINWWILLACLTGGIGFFLILFAKISGKHIKRIKGLANERACIFSFFNLKGYLMMLAMITLGITLRKTGIIPTTPLAYFYFFMGTPLLISAIKFLFAAFTYEKKQTEKKG